jgi:hypothetical protein
VDWSTGDDVQSIVVAVRKDFAKPFFMEVLIMACWTEDYEWEDF